MSEDYEDYPDGWGRLEYVGRTWIYPNYGGVGERVYIRKDDNGVWLMDAGFNLKEWRFEPMEGVRTLEEAKAVAIAIWRMR